MTTTVLNTKISEVENKVLDTRGWVTTTVLNTKIGKVKNKIPNHAKYTTTPEFNKLKAESFAERIKQADLLNKTDFDNKWTSFNKKIVSNKTKYLEVQEKINSIITKDYNFLFHLKQNLFYKLWWISKHVFLSINTWYFRIKKI